MKMKTGIIALLFAISGFASNVFANPNEEVSQVEMDEITASCKSEAKDAEHPEFYEQECISERVQALKEEKGIAPAEKEPS